MPRASVLAALLAILGLPTIWSTVNALWSLWMSDALKSIGMFIPVVSFVLVLRVWRSLGWEMDGSWWGLVILAVTAIVVLRNSFNWDESIGSRLLVRLGQAQDHMTGAGER